MTLFDVEVSTRSITHRVREVDAKRTLTKCGLDIPKKDLDLFTLTIWAVDVTCRGCKVPGQEVISEDT